MATPQTKTRRHCTIDKASASFKPILAWLLNRTASEKLAAVALVNLLWGNVQDKLRQTERYTGNVGDELLADWRSDLREMVTPTDRVVDDTTIAQFALDLEDLVA